MSEIVPAIFFGHGNPMNALLVNPYTQAWRRIGQDTSRSQWDAPSVFWFVGGIDPDIYQKAKASGRVSELPTNHNPRFAPVLHPTLETGVATLVVASRAWLATPTAKR